jgi:hypothetical protein
MPRRGDDRRTNPVHVSRGLEDPITVTDPKALQRPWPTVTTYRRAQPGSGRDELREFACAEGLDHAK